MDDADPMQFLAPPEKEKTEVMNKAYDIKTSCWVKDEKVGFLAGEIQSEKNDKVTVKMVINQLSSTLWVQQESSSLLPPEEVQPCLSPDLFCSVGQPICGSPFLRPPARGSGGLKWKHVQESVFPCGSWRPIWDNTTFFPFPNTADHHG